jgi:hypothetical protein
MIESFLSGTWICGQVLYWFFLKRHTALLDEECWRILSPTFKLDIVVPAPSAPSSWQTLKFMQIVR